MISKETENVQSSEEIEMAFRAITSQVKVGSCFRDQVACRLISVNKPASFSQGCRAEINYWYFFLTTGILIIPVISVADPN